VPRETSEAPFARVLKASDAIERHPRVGVAVVFYEQPADAGSEDYFLEAAETRSGKTVGGTMVRPNSLGTPEPGIVEGANLRGK